MTSTLLNEYQAAALVALSPTLLRSFVSYAPKFGESRKLRVARKDGDMWFFEKDELIEFDKWLRQPWKPRPPDSRPRVPSYIEAEIKVEANGECAICLAHANACEAAHIDPVATSKCNHPHNLIWLCANHHTKFDKHVLGPKEDHKSFVVNLKAVLQRYKTMLWRRQAEVSSGLFDVLDLCARLKAEMAKEVTMEQLVALETVAKEVVSLIPNLAPVSERDKNFSIYAVSKLKSKSLGEKISGSHDQTHRDIEVASDLREEYLIDAGLIQCPLCDGASIFCGNECPVCSGYGTVDKEENIDLSPYDLVACPLASIHDSFEFGECPSCDGENKIQRRFSDHINVRDYEYVKCQLCEGTGREHYNDCRVCCGDGRIIRWRADQLNFSDYENVDCPLCEGTGREGYDDCRVCGGDRRIERQHAESLDLSEFKEVKCPLCDGTGSYDYEDCPACDGNRTMARKDAQQVDVNSFGKISCPICSGTGELYDETCRVCRGDGRITRAAAVNIRKRDYERVSCVRCEGRGEYRDSECHKCNGTGMLLKIDI